MMTDRPNIRNDYTWHEWLGRQIPNYTNNKHWAHDCPACRIVQLVQEQKRLLTTIEQLKARTLELEQQNAEA